MIRALVFVVAFVLAGCATRRVVVLDAKWAPLERVVETTDPTIPLDMTITVDHAAYVRDLDLWAKEYPEGSVDRDALLGHEKKHAERELARGWEWYVLYNVFPSFRWSEEQVGWGFELRLLVAAGRTINASAVARILAEDYKILGVSMVSYDDALAWTNAIVAGK